MTMSEMAKKAKMSRHVNLFLAVVLVLVFGSGRTVAANPLENARSRPSIPPGGTGVAFSPQCV
jgi:hypothetical protein